MQYLKNPHHFRQELTDLLDRLAHVLPAQAPLRDFVHHNTLQGFQHLPFPVALRQARQLTGAYGYLSPDAFRNHYQQGRISAADLEQVLADIPLPDADSLIMQTSDRTIRGRDIYRLALLTDLAAITPGQLVWEFEENAAASRFQAEVPASSRERLLHAAAHTSDVTKATEASALQALWDSCLHRLGLTQLYEHAETICLSTSATTTAADCPDDADTVVIARQRLEQSLQRIGPSLTLRQWLNALTGVDILKAVQPPLLRQLGSWLDQGMASWQARHHPVDTEQAPGFYAYWKQLSRLNPGPALAGISDWEEHLQSLPDNALDTIASELRRMGIPREHWMAYLQTLALELPGWSGMFLWRHQHPDDEQLSRPVSMYDYLAVRLVLEHSHARQLCRDTWLLEASLSNLRGHFLRHPAEFLVRQACCQGELPEFLQNRCWQLIERSYPGSYGNQEWQQLALQIARQQHRLRRHYSSHDHGWRLYLLAQQLGLTPAEISALTDSELESLLSSTQALDEEQQGYLWLQAYEAHYREQVFSALSSNHQRQQHSPQPASKPRPLAQLIFCMDDREEGIRRHLEALNPAIETLGAAAFFNIPMRWRGLDDTHSSKLCPVPVTPVHEIREYGEDAHHSQQHQHQQQRQQGWQNALYQWPRYRLLSGTVLSTLAALPALGTLTAKALAPLGFGSLKQQWLQHFVPPVRTRIAVTADNDAISPQRTASQPQQGFSTEEQAELVAGFLRAHGLSHHVARLVVLMGHYSTNENNPHQAAYGCGACSGRYSGPNARSFAAMANRPQVRKLLAERGLVLPKDCWFIGAEHDTCSEAIRWADTDLIPRTLLTDFNQLDASLTLATQHSAHERCRKLASAPREPDLHTAAKHIATRAMDYSQPRPELGHATNAVAMIGRRAMSQGVFWDRRAFLISYDYHDDPDGCLLENLLLSVGPVGAGINLEYYFSTVANERYGAGSKVTHNLAGLFGVMQGTNSDLRTGLPWQMVEIHEAMRLLMVLETRTELATAIYQRQPALQELIGNGWVLLAVQDPDSGAIDFFKPDQGFIRWQQNPAIRTAEVTSSAAWYAGHSDHLPPALLGSSPCQTPHRRTA